MFECKHRFSDLLVQSGHSVERMDAEYEKVTYHFVCSKCGKRLDLSCLHLVGGVDAFLSRADSAIA